ncbi:hypothetical protein ACIP6P_25555 [Streptomyces sp. NPDC088729]|uniref:hypothetical protein n=1 Tax=unclassified Streptomyces TaxID=2593676 RepID=UPI000F559140|nr:hypothetical protein [Streptomyces sp. ADI96-02]
MASAMLAVSAGCGNSEAPHVVKASELVGSWRSADGGVVTFHENRDLEVDGLPLQNSFRAGCPDGSTAQSWSFFADSGDSVGSLQASPDAAEGSSISIGFAEDVTAECLVDFNVIDGGDAICVSDDIDRVCSSEVRLRRV